MSTEYENYIAQGRGYYFEVASTPMGDQWRCRKCQAWQMPIGAPELAVQSKEQALAILKDHSVVCMG